MRISEYGKAHAVRFKKKTDKALSVFCLDNEVRLSRVIQSAVECFLKNSNCVARKKVTEDLL
jgi:hypothetical protein